MANYRDTLLIDDREGWQGDGEGRTWWEMKRQMVERFGNERGWGRGGREVKGGK